MSPICDVPACIHDCPRTYREETTEHATETVVTCDGCQSVLWIQRRLASEIAPTITVVDDVYDQMYTKRGMRALVVEALENRGWPVPERWLRKEWLG